MQVIKDIEVNKRKVGVKMAVIYLDNAATTPVWPEVVDAMLPYYRENYGNPSGIYGFAEKRKEDISNSRKRIASSIGARDKEIYFTSGGTESDNWALQSAVLMVKGKKRHIITTEIEHHAILNTCLSLEKQGVEITYLKVDENGMVSPEEVERAIRPYTCLVSVMFANNEVGTIQPIEKIGRITKKYHVPFHTDAVQAYGHIPINVKTMNIDMLSASGHKFNGPKGIGFLYINKEINLPPFLYGGHQENGKRAGTENVAGIIGIGKAAEMAENMQGKDKERIRKMRDHLIDRILTEIPYSRVNGSRKHRLPGNCNFSFQFIEGTSLLILLDTDGICASAGSACSSGETSPSHVLSAMGVPNEIARGTLRLTIGYQNTMEEMDYAVECIKKHVKKLREGSPEFEDYQNKNLANQ